MKHEAQQYELEMPGTGTVEREVVTVDGAALADKLHELERSGWRVVALNRLPRNVGYGLEVERKGKRHEL